MISVSYTSVHLNKTIHTFSSSEIVLMLRHSLEECWVETVPPLTTERSAASVRNIFYAATIRSLGMTLRLQV